MILPLLSHLEHTFPFLRIFQYISFRAALAMVSSLFISLWLTPKLIRILKKVQRNGQPIQHDGPQSHLLTKQGTPTMGGLMILISLVTSVLLWGSLSNPYIQGCLFVAIGFGSIGFWDDYIKVSKNHNSGMTAKTKFALQCLIAGLATAWIQFALPNELSTTLALPFFKDLLIDLGVFFIPWSILVIVGASNAVNLTDGLDGLAIGPIVIVTACFLIISYLVGHNVFSKYLFLHYVPESGELAVFCASLIGAGLGFLWFNAPPAQVFMGDTGSVSMGALLGSISVITKHEFVLAIVGGLFVIETLSVVIQVLVFKKTGKRIFLMAPLHHHFEQKGWSEPTIVIRFWIISIVLGLIGLATLKLR